MSLYTASIDLTKAFDLVGRDGLFQVLPKIGCPPKLQIMIESFHNDKKGTLRFNGSSSEPFEIRSGVKQGCVLAPNALWDFLWPVAKTCIRHNSRRNLPPYPIRWQALQYSSSQSQDKGTQGSHQGHAVCWWRSSCDPHPGGNPVIDGLLSHACKDFGLTINLKKPNVLGQDTETPPVITIDDYELDAVCQFTYLGSTITDKDCHSHIGISSYKRRCYNPARH